MKTNYKQRLDRRRSRTCARIFNYMLDQVERDGRKEIYDRYDDILMAWIDALVGTGGRIRIQDEIRMEQKAKLHREGPDPHI